MSTHDLGRDRCAVVTVGVAGVHAGEVMSRPAEASIDVSTTVPEHNQFDTELRGVHPLVQPVVPGLHGGSSAGRDRSGRVHVARRGTTPAPTSGVAIRATPRRTVCEQ